MKIIYTKHAEEMLTFRSIRRDLIEKCLKHPDKILPAKLEKLTYLKDYGKNYLKVVVKEKNQLLVVTVYWLAKKRAKM